MKKQLTIILSLLLLLQSIVSTHAIKEDTPRISANKVAIMDASTHQLIYGVDPYEKLAPASTTKIMTALVALESGVPLDTPITIDTSLFASIGSDDAQLQFSDGEVFTLRDMLFASAVYSANDAAIAIAQCVGGNIEDFVNMMNQKANDIGCLNTHFVTVNGLDADDHYSTAYDMSLIMARAIQNESFNQIFSAISYDMPATKTREAFTIHNTSNHSINPNSSYHIDGIVSSKIGFTTNAKACEVSYIQKEGRSFIVSTFGGSGDDVRAQDQLALVDYFTTKYQAYDLPQSYTTPKLSLPFIYSSNVKNIEQFDVQSANTIYAYSDTNTYPITRKFSPAPLTKSAKAGDLAGYYNYYQNGEVIHQQKVLLTDQIHISISIMRIITLIAIVILSILLYIALLFLIIGILQMIDRRNRKKRRRVRR